MPLRTAKGINIGSIFVIGSKIRPPLTAAERHFLGDVANNVIKHLEMLKDRRDCERSLTMSACMSAYIDPLNTQAATKIDVHGKPASNMPPLASTADVEDDTGRLGKFRRAADFLLKGLDYDESGGGVMFLDTLPVGDQAKYSTDENTATSSNPESDDEAQSRIDISPVNDMKQDWISNSGLNKVVNTTEILAHATRPEETSRSDGSAVPQTGILSPEYLSKLIKRFPNGRMFTFNSYGHSLASSSDEAPRHPLRSDVSSSGTLNAKRHEMKGLRHCFPTARQIIFLPIWDSTTSRWAVCITYHNSRFRTLSYKSEFVYCATFGNLLIAELTKLMSLQAGRQKNDFIASISHELRSPLHGILASCEFLEDTELSLFQQSLVDTATGCSRTLLDTINMVLDYSKINRFEKLAHQSNKARRNLSADSRSKILQSSLNTQRVVDVAALVEEVIDSTIAGYAFEDRLKNKGAMSADAPSPATPETPVDKMILFKDRSFKFILDISVQDWTYCSDPGALRRIVMNLVENATRFTKDGFVHVKLQSGRSKSSRGLPFILLTVSDTGRGISPTYLKDTLFTPFSQESSLTHGSGLGLSLVKSLIRTMGGKINIESVVDEGTSVTVKLPMIHKGRDDKPSLGNFDNAAERNRSIAISAVRAYTLGKTAAINWHISPEIPPIQRKALELLQRSLLSYLSRWFGLSISPWQHGSTYDVIISDIDGLEALKHADPESFVNGCQHIIISTTASLRPSSNEDGSTPDNISVLNCPFGPFRLAKILRSCLRKTTPGEINLSEINLGKINTIETLSSVASTTGSLSVEDSSEFLLSSRTSETTEQQCADQAILIDSAEIKEPATPAQHHDHTVIPTAPWVEAAPNITPRSMSISFAPPKSPLLAVTETDLTSTQPLATEDPTKTSTTGAEPATPPPRMLLVDDNAINLRLLQVFSKKLGCTSFHSAENGLLAVQAYDSLLYATPSAPPTVILMDLSMPVMDGFEATRQIRQSESDYAKQLPAGETSPRSLIIALTGLSSVKDQKEAFAAGVDRYIMKPVNFAKFSLLLLEWQAGGEGKG